MNREASDLLAGIAICGFVGTLIILCEVIFK